MIAITVLVLSGAAALAAAGGEKAGEPYQRGVRQRVRSDRGRRPQDRRGPRRGDDGLQGHQGEPLQGGRGVRDQRAGCGRAAGGCALRDPPAVADRRVLRGLPAGQLREEAGRGRHDPRGADQLHDPGGPGQQHPAPPLPRAAAADHRRAGHGPGRPRAPTSARCCAAPIPGLRETSRTLRILANQNQHHPEVHRRRPGGDRAAGEPQGRRGDAGWTRRVRPRRSPPPAARSSSATSQLLPGFLDELRPYMVQLGNWPTSRFPRSPTCRPRLPTSTRSWPGSAPSRKLRAPPSAGWARPPTPACSAFRASPQRGRRAARPRRDVPGLAKPLRQLLQTLDDRKRAAEPDPRAKATGPPAPDKTHISGTGGFTAMEALWNYFYWQGLAINGRDDVGHVLKIIGVEDSDCTPYYASDEGEEADLRPLQPVPRPQPARDHHPGPAGRQPPGRGADIARDARDTPGAARRTAAPGCRMARPAAPVPGAAPTLPPAVTGDGRDARGPGSAQVAPKAPSGPTGPVHRQRSSTTSSRHEQNASRTIDRGQPRARGRGHRADRGDRGVHRLQRQLRPALRAHLRPQGGGAQRRQARGGQRGPPGRVPRRARWTRSPPGARAASSMAVLALDSTRPCSRCRWTRVWRSGLARRWGSSTWS